MTFFFFLKNILSIWTLNLTCDKIILEEKEIMYMDKTEEKVVDIAGLQKILQENDYTSILFSDSDEWTKEQKDALDILLQYTDSKPSFIK